MLIHKRLSVSLFAAVLALTSCSFSPIAQNGYEKIKEDIKSNLQYPSTYKGEEVDCYDIASVYQYRIVFSGENGLGLRGRATAYYTYNFGSDSIKNRGSDASYFNEAKAKGNKHSISA